VISDKEGNGNGRKDGSDDSESEDTYSTVTVMPTSTICPSMVRGSSINSRDTSTPKSINHPFVDDDDASAAMRPSASATSCQSLNSYNSDALEMEPFLLTSEPTRAGRRWKCRDMSSLSLCLCGVSVQPDTAGSIRCQRAGCETIWVSDPFPLFIEYN